MACRKDSDQTHVCSGQVLRLLAVVYIGAGQPGAAQNCIEQLRTLQLHGGASQGKSVTVTGSPLRGLTLNWLSANQGLCCIKAFSPQR